MAIKNDVYSHVPVKKPARKNLLLSPNARTFRERLNYLMTYYGVTAKELADAVYVCTSTINKYVVDCRTPSLEVAASIADYFDVSLDWLAGRSDIPRPDKEDHHEQD